ncbi:hypothetical protein M8J77_016766 [Diaphorina citri]|nr:hypothetical protein M8J77_016766 [Diaphorina citri]
MGKGLRMPQFEIADIRASDCQESFQIGNYSCLVAEFYLNRSVGFHLIQSYLPTILIVIISWVSFWMDVDSVPGRTTLGVTTLLAVSSQSSGIQAGLPQVSYVKAIDVWMGTCTAFVFCALLEFTFVNYMWRKLQPDLLRKVVSVPDEREGGGGEYQTDLNGKNRGLAGAQENNSAVAAPLLKQTPDYQTELRKQNKRCSLVVQMRKVTMVHNPSDPDFSHSHAETKYSLGLNYSERARRIDEYSRLLFPLTFLVFNMFYWSYYLGFN